MNLWTSKALVCAAIAMLLAGRAFSDTGASTASEAEPLAPGMTEEQAVADGQTLRFQLRLPTGQALALRFVQLGDGGVRLSIRSGEASQAAVIEPLHVRGASARMSLVADMDSTWTLDVASTAKGHGSRYQLVLGTSHKAIAADRQNAVAQLNLAQAEALRRSRKKENYAQSAALYRDALLAFVNLNDGCSARLAYEGLAALHDVQAEYPASQAAAERALHQVCDSDFTEQALAYAALGSAKANQGDFAGAADAAEHALPLLRKVGDTVIQSGVLSNLSDNYRALGETNRALATAELSRQLAEASGNRWSMIFAQETIAGIHAERGEPAIALAAYRQALTYLRDAPDAELEGSAWVMVGELHHRLGDIDESYEDYNKAEAAFTSIEQWLGFANVSLSRGDSLLTDGRPQEAAAAFGKARDLGHERGLPNVQGKAARGLARCAMAAGDWAQAQALLREALDQALNSAEPAAEAQAESAMGDLDRSRKDAAGAQAHYERALVLVRGSGDHGGEVLTLASLAALAADRNKLDTARDLLSRALGIVESARGRIDEPALRSAWFNTTHNYYALYVDVLMRLDEQRPGKGYAEQALAVVERARARSLQDELRERGIGVAANVDDRLLSAERESVDQVNGLAYELSHAPADRRASLLSRLNEAEAQLDELRGQLRKANPRYAELSDPRQLPIGQLRRRVLGGDAIALEYWLGAERSYLWVVRVDGIRAYRLPAEARISALSETLRSRLLARPGSDIPLDQREQAEAGQLASIGSAASDLADQILAPAHAELGGRSKIFVVADGALQLIPFVLLDDALGDSGPFKASARFSYLPSLGTLRWLREEPASAGATAVAVFADPIFRADDPRLGASMEPAGKSAASGGEDDDPLIRATSDTGIAELPRLPNSRAEAQAIAALLPAEQSRLLLDFGASRNTVLDTQWRDYRIAHFATHALLDMRRPELSGIVLSLFDEQGHPRDGFLRINDIYGLRMPRALVVLSACESAVGQLSGSEGMFSLARGFFYAGASRVIATLWSVDDRATTELMRHFYQALLIRKQPAANALLAAQRELAADPRWRSPFYWAGFVLQGDDQ